MNKNTVASLLFLATLSGFVAARADDAVAFPGHGEVRVVKSADGWTASLRRADDGSVRDLFEVELTVSGGKGLPKEIRLDHVMQQLDVQFTLSPDVHSHFLAQRRQIRHLPQGCLPLFAYVSAADANRLTMACSETLRPVVLDCGEDNFTGSILHSRVRFFGLGGEDPKETYRARAV